MPKILRVRAPQDEKEEKQVRKLAPKRLRRRCSAIRRPCVAGSIALTSRVLKDWGTEPNRGDPAV